MRGETIQLVEVYYEYIAAYYECWHVYLKNCIISVNEISSQK